LLNVAGGLNHRPEELNLPLRLVMGTFAKVMSFPVIGHLLFNRIRQRSQIKRTLKQVYGNPEAVTDELVEFLHQPSCDPGAQKVMAAILRAPAGPRVSELLPDVNKPLLVLWGEADPWTPISAGKIFQEAQAKPPQADCVVTFQGIPATGHCPHDERPELVNPAILNWLATQGF
ncbi:MAG: alpha/beta hydrolase, partial [Acaryochloridaceae cyanobacterium RL_2_7]|nr:alpha/beta hydrolase [Acaryochloridaceae cyanobacterium RL_2_7]